MDQIPMKNQVTSAHNPQSGSIFIWIFVMIALFGALSFAISKSTRTGSQSLSADKAKLAATEILEFGRLVRSGVASMLINGIPLETISFEMESMKSQDGSPYQDVNSNCTEDKCKVFKPSGGGVKEVTFFQYAAPTTSYADAGAPALGGMRATISKVEGLGSAANDIVIHFVDIHKDVCTALNKLMGVADGPVVEYYSGNLYSMWDPYADLDGPSPVTYGNSATELVGKQAFCIDTSSGGGDIIIVVKAR